MKTLRKESYDDYILRGGKITKCAPQPYLPDFLDVKPGRVSVSAVETVTPKYKKRAGEEPNFGNHTFLVLWRILGRDIEKKHSRKRS